MCVAKLKSKVRAEIIVCSLKSAEHAHEEQAAQLSSDSYRSQLPHQHVAAVFKPCSLSALQLVSLDLSHTGIGDLGAAHIAQAVQGSTSITSLDLSGNSVATDTGMVLASTFKVSS